MRSLFLVVCLSLIAAQAWALEQSFTNCHWAGNQLYCDTTTLDTTPQPHQPSYVGARGLGAIQAVRDVMSQRQAQADAENDARRAAEYNALLQQAEALPDASVASETDFQTASSLWELVDPGTPCRCSVGGELYRSDVRYCPIHGVELQCQ